MQAIAPTGSIATTERTRRLVEGYFRLRARGPTRIKGVSGPVEVYEVTGLGPLRTRLQRAAGRGLSKFVGRERELEALKHAAELAAPGARQIVAAVAEAGVGKSRLFHEFKVKNQSGWMGGVLGLAWQGQRLPAGDRAATPKILPPISSAAIAAPPYPSRPRHCQPRRY